MEAASPLQRRAAAKHASSLGARDLSTGSLGARDLSTGTAAAAMRPRDLAPVESSFGTLQQVSCSPTLYLDSVFCSIGMPMALPESLSYT